jgi:hypothetical protein
MTQDTDSPALMLVGCTMAVLSLFVSEQLRRRSAANGPSLVHVVVFVSTRCNKSKQAAVCRRPHKEAAMQ